MKVNDYLANEVDFLTPKETDELKNILNCINASGDSDRAEKEIKKVLEE